VLLTKATYWLFMAHLALGQVRIVTKILFTKL